MKYNLILTLVALCVTLWHLCVTLCHFVVLSDIANELLHRAAQRSHGDTQREF